MKIEYVAMLARLKLTEQEKELFSKQIDDVLDYINKLNALDTGGVEPTAHVISIKNVFRGDKLTPSLSGNKALLNAPDRNDNFYRVPKIIE